jgi:hypothetical protein
VAGAWCERSILNALDGTWITGVVDRAVIERDVVGQRSTRAMVVDFESNRVEGWTRKEWRRSAAEDSSTCIDGLLTYGRAFHPSRPAVNSCLPTLRGRLRCNRPQILLYRGKKAPHGAVQRIIQPYGQSEEETSAQDEQAQAP